jgi:hypothetical protein
LNLKRLRQKSVLNKTKIGGIKMTKYRKKPVVIEAIEWTGKNFNEIQEFAGSESEIIKMSSGETELVIRTLEGRMTASEGDYIIKGIQGEFYPCKSDIFEQTYELA